MKIIEDLWYSYILENTMKQTTEEKKILRSLVKYEEELESILGEKQKTAFKHYEDYLDKLHSVFERNAFIEGIRFATLFLIEALYKN